LSLKNETLILDVRWSNVILILLCYLLNLNLLLSIS